LDKAAPVIEDFYTLLMDHLSFEKAHPLTLVKSIQWQAFRNLILKEPLVLKAVKEVRQW
jgi:hypothetical protein